MKKPLSERWLLILLAAVQFTHITDFMILMPLGPQLMRELAVQPAGFSVRLSLHPGGRDGQLYAAPSGLLTWRPLLLCTYAGFILGTLACALSHSAQALMLSRAVCGAFGGVSGALVLAIVSDIVPWPAGNSRVGIIMTVFSIAAALGVPFGLFLSQRFNWEAPFWLLAGLSSVTWAALYRHLPPVRHHLSREDIRGFSTFLRLLRNPNAGWALLFMAVLVFSHFTVIPLLGAFLVQNVGLPEKDLYLFYLVGGVLTVFSLPYVGRLADRHGRWRVFAILVGVAALVTLFLTNAPRLPLWVILVLGGLFFTFASGRFVPGQAILSLAVAPSQRGAFLSLSACTRDFASGLVSSLGGAIVHLAPDGTLQHYSTLGWIAVGFGALSLAIGAKVKVEDTHAHPAVR